MSSTTDCQPDAGDCPTVGLPLYWPNGCLSYSVNEEGSPLRNITYEVAQELTDQAVARWAGSDCGGGQTPSLETWATSMAICDTTGFSTGGGNLNLIVFRDDDWRYSNDGAVLAFTTLNYDTRNGRILDADIEINSEYSQLTASDNQVVDDLDSILTHELGHFFGLSHVPHEDATMFKSYQPGETLKRSLSADDIAGICAIYPPGENTAYCNPEPYKGYDPTCFAARDAGCEVTEAQDGFNPNCLPIPDEGCAVTTPSPSSPAPWLLAGALALGATLRRRRSV